MLSVADVVAELGGNSFNDDELLDFSRELTHFLIMRDNLTNALKEIYEDYELEEMLGSIVMPTRQQQVISNSLTSFSPREKQCYVMYTVDLMSFSAIGRSLGISKSTVQQSIERARKKIELTQSEELFA